MASTTSAVIQWLASADKKGQLALDGKNLTLKVNNDVVKEPNAVARAVAQAVHPALAGASPVDQAQVAQWQAWVATQTEGFGAEAAELNQMLATRSFLAGQQLTVADVQVYWAVVKGVEQTFPGPLGGLPHLLRWFNQIQHAVRMGAFAAHDASLLPKLLPVQGIYKPIAMPVFAKEGTGAGAGRAAKQGAAQQQQPKGKEGKPAQQEQEMQPPNEGGKGGGKEACAGKKGAKAEGKKGGAAPAPAAEDEDLDNPNCLNLRVGKIVKAWPHPESDKLWCESIDLGEEAPREIASGLRHFYPNESDLTGRMVLVLANLKPRKLAGFSSNGMVLCASNEAHDVVRFVEVPASAKVGDRIVFQGEGIKVVPPLEPNKLQKKKVFEALAPGLVTNGDGVCNYKGAAFTLEGSTEVCTAPLPNAHVS